MIMRWVGPGYKEDDSGHKKRDLAAEELARSR